MKERRKAGATHSFRLTMAAAKIVDNITYPRRLGGKSRKVSEAIELWASAEEQLEPETPIPLGGGWKAILAKIWPF